MLLKRVLLKLCVLNVCCRARPRFIINGVSGGAHCNNVTLLTRGERVAIPCFFVSLVSWLRCALERADLRFDENPRANCRLPPSVCLSSVGTNWTTYSIIPYVVHMVPVESRRSDGATLHFAWGFAINPLSIASDCPWPCHTALSLSSLFLSTGCSLCQTDVGFVANPRANCCVPPFVCLGLTGTNWTT